MLRCANASKNYYDGALIRNKQQDGRNLANGTRSSKLDARIKAITHGKVSTLTSASLDNNVNVEEESTADINIHEDIHKALSVKFSQGLNTQLPFQWSRMHPMRSIHLAAKAAIREADQLSSSNMSETNSNRTNVDAPDSGSLNLLLSSVNGNGSYCSKEFTTTTLSHGDVTNNKEFPLGFVSIHIPISHLLISDAIHFTTMVMTIIAMLIQRRLRVVRTWKKAMINEKSKSDAALFNKKM